MPPALFLDLGDRPEGLAPINDFDAFFEANYWPIVRSLTAAFGTDVAVDEAVQDAFVKAHSRWRRIRAYDSPAAWVRRVAINRLHDQRRANERRRRAEGRAGVEAEAQGIEDAEGNSSESEIVAMIQQLPPRQRLAMALFYVGDASVREIATSMRISEGAVKAHLSQGRANLSKAVDTAPASDDHDG